MYKRQILEREITNIIIIISPCLLLFTHPQIDSSDDNIPLSQIAVTPIVEEYIWKLSGLGNGRGGIVAGTSRGVDPILSPLTRAREKARAI